MLVPCRPGPVGSFLSRPEPADSCWPSWLGDDVGLQPVDRRQEDRRRDVLPADLLVVERGLDRRTHARLVGDVGGEEDLHLARDLLDRLVGGLALVAERGADPLGDEVEPVAAPLERDQQRLVRAAHLVRHVEALGLRELLVGLHLELEIAL